MAFWNKKNIEEQEERAREASETDDIQWGIYLGGDGTEITTKQALDIPSYSSSVEKVANLCSMLPIKLYKEVIEQGKKRRVEEVKSDIRVKLLNDETGDTLDGKQFKNAMIRDYLNEGNGYAYINKRGTKVKSLHYVDQKSVSLLENQDVIFKCNKFSINGTTYEDFQIMKLLRNSKNGGDGIGIVEESNLLLSTAFNTIRYENNVVCKGGNKKGFLKSKKHLTDIAFDKLKQAWRNLNSNSNDSVILLNDGIEFQESSQTFVELQMDENKKNLNNEIRSLFNIPVNGSRAEFIKDEIIPILNAFETMLNSTLLLEREKGTYYFAFDTRELLKGDLKERYEAYKIGIDSGFITQNEVRYYEDLAEIEGLNIVKMSLADVIYDIDSKTYFTPNTKTSTNLGENTDISNNIDDNQPNLDEIGPKGGEE